MTFLATLLVLLGGASAYHWLACRRERRRFPPPGELIELGGYRMHLHILGEEGGPTVVLDSALAGSSLSWSEIQPKVARFTKVVSYDRAGFGWSDPGPHPRTLHHMTLELHELLHKADVEGPFVLVGHSYGGWIAQLMASRHPDLVAGLILVDTPHPREWAEPDDAQRRRVARGARAARLAALAAPFGFTRAFLQLSRFRSSSKHNRIASLLGKTPAPIRPQLRSFWMRPTTLEALAGQIQNAPEGAARLAAETRSLGNIPLVALTAADPSPQRLEDQLSTVALSCSGRHVIAETSEHWIPLEEPELVVQVIRDVVDSVRA